MLVTATKEAKLSVELAPATAAEAANPIEIRLGDVVGESFSSQLDPQGNRLLVMRSPGDKLRVQFDRSSLVFSPGEVFEVEIQPHLLGLPAGTNVRLSAQLTSAATAARHWSQEFEATSNEPGSPGKPFALSVKLPEAEGVYDLIISAANPRQRLPWKKTFVDRKVQLVVIDSKPPADETAAFNKLVEIDPVNPRWWDRLGNIPLIPGERKGPLGNGDAARWEHPQLGAFIQLGPGARGAKTSWEAYPLPLNQPGHPHILEVEYPSDVPQTLGLSILEPNAAGAVMPIGLDSGVYVADEESENAAAVAEASAGLLAANEVAAAVGHQSPRRLAGRCTARSGSRGRRPDNSQRCRWAGPATGPRNCRGPSRASQRRPAAGRLLRPAPDRRELFGQRSARSLQPPQPGRLDHLLSGRHAAGRLLEICGLQRPDALRRRRWQRPLSQRSFAADAPSRHGSLFRQRPRSGAEGCAGTAVSALRPRKAAADPGGSFLGSAAGARVLAATGCGGRRLGLDRGRRRAWFDNLRDRADQTPPYNPLDPRVQNAMLAVVRELAQRYGGHSSFGGIALQLSAEGYAQLPTPDGGYDDDTIARFQRDTAREIPGEGTTRFAARARFLNGSGKTSWHTWRANQLAALHQRMQQEIAEARPEAHLYLAGATLFEHRHPQRSLRPALPRRMKADEVLLALGIRPEAYHSDERIVLLRPQEIGPAGPLPAQGVDLEINQAPEVDRLFSNHRYSASLFYHEPQRARIASFDAKSPFGAATTFTSLVSELSPSAERNRRRFVHSVATLDAQQMFDGGWLLPLGQEAALADLVSVYRQLPAARFDTLAEESQPVTIRSLTRAGQTYVYLANDSPWPLSVTLDVDVPPGTRLEKLGNSSGIGPVVRTGDTATWTVALKPYDLTAARFSAAGVQFHGPKAKLSPQVAASLERRIRDLSARTAALSTPMPLGVLENSGCEAPPAEDGSVPGWTLTSQPGVRLELQDADAHGGSHSLKLKSSGAPAVLRSGAFAAPATGRLSVAIWLRTPDRKGQPGVRLALEAKSESGDYFRYATLGAGSPAAQLTEQWAQFIFQVDDLPVENVADVRVRLDLLGAGEILLDDVQLYDLAFAEHERVELTKIITLASYKLQAGQVADCARILEGYWPQFLLANVPLVQRPLPLAQRVKADSTPPHEPVKKPGKLEQIKGYLPKWPQF